MLGKIILVKSIASASFCGFEENPGAMRKTNSLEKMKTITENKSITNKIIVKILEEKYCAAFSFFFTKKSV
ncbi:hypothetical protein FACS1894113_5190 [Alphaproteobacteria bacterium]|nr:hypothetical protein FACS1894113_5190 [Alphaproteobacteria bacterium]